MFRAITIRRIKADDDFGALTALLHRAYAQLAEMGLNYTACDQNVETTRHRAGSGVCYLAEVEGRVVGTVVADSSYGDDGPGYYLRKGVVVLTQFAVEPSLQSTGIGKALVRHLEAEARSKGIEEVALDTAEQAVHLIETYKRWGFRMVGHHQWQGKSYRSVVMAKRL